LKKLALYIRDHLREDFNPVFYLFVMAFLGLTFYVNFFMDREGFRSGTWEDAHLSSKVSDPLTMLKFLLFYGLPYYSTFLVYVLLYRKTYLLLSGRFWLRSLFILSVLSVNSGFFYHRSFIRENVAPQVAYFFDYVAANAGSTLFFFVPILLFYLLVDRPKHRTDAGLYGLTRKRFTPGPYVLILAIMLPVVFAASTTFLNPIFGPDSQRSFLATYPTYKASYGIAESYLGVQGWVTTAIYEVFYLFDFIFVELLFRGFMVIGMASILGRGAIMPMVTTYAFLHFGKPLGEAVGSIFGGYILGVIAYSGRNIWGGAMVHGGVALMMELSAIFQWNVMKVNPFVTHAR
jgi:hypothetical protein